MQKKLFRIKQVADQLCISRSTAWLWVKKGILPPPIKIGGCTFWKSEEIDEVINHHQGA